MVQNNYNSSSSDLQSNIFLILLKYIFVLRRLLDESPNNCLPDTHKSCIH